MTERTAPPDETAITLSDASYAFRDVPILNGVSLELRSGEFTALVGPNGTGKTTLLELFAGLRSPDAGTVTRPPTPERTVAYLPQTPGFRSGFTTRETVHFYADLVDADTDPDALLTQVGIADAADRRIDELSGGMTRLLGIAQALIGDPPVVVLDEPTSGLDPNIADHIFDVVETVADGGRLVVMASHDLTAVEARADRAILLSDGNVVLDGSPAELLDAAGAETLRDAFATTFRTEHTSTVSRPAPNGGRE